MDLCEQSPSYIRAIAPYQPGKPISELAREMGLNEKKIVKPASNENPLGVSPKARAAIKKALAELARYPDGNAFELKPAFARRHGVREECIVVGNGSNDLLELAAGDFLAPGRAAVYSQHAFAVYPLATQARGARGIVVPAKNYGHDLEAMLAAITPETRVVFIANPNNPTGTFATGGEIGNFLARARRDVAVVVDEAYSEYVPPNLRYDSVTLLEKYSNLILTRTFSKVYGLAGPRVGFGLMHPAVADLLNRVRQPFNVNSLALAAAVAALEDRKFVAKSTRMNRLGLARLERAFKTLGLEFIPSCANFVAFRVSRAGAGDEKLVRQGVILRPLAKYDMPDHPAATVGQPNEDGKFRRGARTIAPLLGVRTVVTDAGSTKQGVVELARRELKGSLSRFVPGHPIAGTEKSGAEAAFAELYRGRKVVLTPLRDNDPGAIALVRSAWESCGADVFEMKPKEHDAVLATVSHLPHLLAYALVDLVAGRKNATQLFSFAAGGFRDFTRIASSHPEMWRDICLANREALLVELNRYGAGLDKLRTALKRGDARTLDKLFSGARAARNRWLEDGE